MQLEVKNKFKKALVFVAALLPAALIGGYSTGVYGFASLPSTAQALVLEQVGNLHIFYLVTVLQTLVYAVVCGFAGYLTADKIGLLQPLKFERRAVVPTLALTLLCSCFFSIDLFVFRKLIPQVADLYAEKPSLAYWLSSLLYGGVIEEVMLRLFLLSVLSLAVWKIFFRSRENPPPVVLVAMNIFTALLFAAGHLPATAQMFGELTPLLLLRCFLLNGAGGLIFGWLFCKFGIQYAMISHAGVHVVWKILWLALSL